MLVARTQTRLTIGYILSLEGADSLRTLDDLANAYDQGLRALGPAHYGIGRYALGHDQSGSLSAAGRELLGEMDQLGMILDVTHLAEATFWDALEVYRGPCMGQSSQLPCFGRRSLDNSAIAKSSHWPSATQSSESLLTSGW